MNFGNPFDRYVIQARIMPVLLVVFPLASLVVVWLPADSFGWRLLSGLISLILLSMVAQLGRDAGRKCQTKLFKKWGGRPSVRKLRSRDSDLPWITLERLRSKLAAEVGVPNPTKAEEDADPASTDEVFSAYVDHLLEVTRGDAILLAENIGYGFRRNLWGMKPAGFVLAFIGLLGAGVGTMFALGPNMVVPATVTVLNATLVTLWVLRVNERWVRESAEAYADRLVRAYLIQKEGNSSAAA